VRSASWTAAVFAIVFLVDASCPVVSSFDSRWTIPVALSLLDHGDTNLDEYAATIDPADHTIERVNGHYYNWYPVTVPVLAAPIVFGLRKAAPLLHAILPNGGPIRAAFLNGDFLVSRTLVEVLTASVFVALTSVVVFFIGRLFLHAPCSALLSMIFAFGTSAWSTASRGLWQHGPSMLMLSIALYLLLLADRKPWLSALVAIPTMLAYLLRPNNLLFVAATTVYVAMRYKRYLLPYLLIALPIAVTFLTYNESIYGTLLPTYFSRKPPVTGNPIRVVEALSGALVSPSRGLFVYSPILVISIWGMVRALKSRWQAPLATYLIAVLVGNWLLLGLYFHFWWGGHSYGPRQLSDMTPFFVFFLIPPLLKWRESAKPLGAASVFLVLLAVSVFIHSRGARSADVYLWNVSPQNVDQNPTRLWDWRDPQFLRGLH
jgi:hypothetical protein